MQPAPQLVNYQAQTPSNLFVNAVLNGSGDFSQAYSLLKLSCDQAAGQAGGGIRSVVLLGGPDRLSPVTTCKRTLGDLLVEPLKLKTAGQNKRPRSSTIVEVPEDLTDGYESELAFSRSSSPAAAAPSANISPRKPTRSCFERPMEREQTKSPRQVKHGLGGERRLNIHFINTGILEEPVQTFGKYKLLIRDGLCGTHTMYAQPWRFEINHHSGGDAAGEIRLRWTVTNLASGHRMSFLETSEQAHERQVKGNTICNVVVREALNQRAGELEEEMRTLEPSNTTRIANIRSLIKELRPKQCTEGLLFFGLRHQAAQSRE